MSVYRAFSTRTQCVQVEAFQLTAGYDSRKFLPATRADRLRRLGTTKKESITSDDDDDENENGETRVT